MIKISKLIEELQKYPDNATLSAYYGEIGSISIFKDKKEIGCILKHKLDNEAKSFKSFYGHYIEILKGEVCG